MPANLFLCLDPCTGPRAASLVDDTPATVDFMSMLSSFANQLLDEQHREHDFATLEPERVNNTLIYAHPPFVFLSCDHPAWTPIPHRSVAIDFCPEHILLLDRPCVILWVDIEEFINGFLPDSSAAGLTFLSPDGALAALEWLSHNTARDIAAEANQRMKPLTDNPADWFAHYHRIVMQLPKH